MEESDGKWQGIYKGRVRRGSGNTQSRRDWKTKRIRIQSGRMYGVWMEEVLGNAKETG